MDAELFDRIRFRGVPQADPESIVVRGKARFSVLTSRLLRLEWSETGEFEDRSTYAFPTRQAPAPDFSLETAGDSMVLDTGALTLHYRSTNGPFTRHNLAITFMMDGVRRTWVPGQANAGNLRGTRRTLDNCRGDASLEEGLVSREGWALFDDSASVLFDSEDGWVVPRPDHAVQDWYFFGYGHRYQEAVSEYRWFGHPVPLIPRFVLGAWWSRYWAYSEQDLKELIGEFEKHGLPLDVLVVDMDWHTPRGWTGYTWNRELFPDPPAFLRWVHDKGLQVTLNLHPALGVQPFEEIYPRFAQAMGVDPETGQPVPFRVADRRFVENYFDLLHHPMEDEGVDFWWLDWQQGQSTEVKGLDPLPWLNHLHFSDSGRRGFRPLIYSRWGGLGSHRYPVGFSGDTFATWGSLRFQPFFTATAANVAFGWWSHDIGGHQGGATEAELYARWVQSGALSPVLRLHATKDPRAERRPWAFSEPVYQAAKAAFRLRYALVPYLYTLARQECDTGRPLCRPMYYDHPEQEAAYVARHQYMLGEQVIAAPIVHPADPETGLAATDVWVPGGNWIDRETLETYAGPRWVRILGGLNRVPMLMKAGAILPLAPAFRLEDGPRLASGRTDALPKDHVVVDVFPGEQGAFRLYDDDGATDEYRDGQYEWTPITSRMQRPDTWEVQVGAVEGRCEALPRERSLEIWLEGSRLPDWVTVDGQPADFDYDSEALRTVIQVPKRDKGLTTAVLAHSPMRILALGPSRDTQQILCDAGRLLGREFPDGTSEEELLEEVRRLEPRRRADAVARLGGPFVRLVEYSTLEEVGYALGRLIVGAPRKSGEPFDVEATFTLHLGTATTHRSIQVKQAATPLIEMLPFAFHGQLQPLRWEAAVRLRWRGLEVDTSYQSQPLLSSIHTWHAAVFRTDRQQVDAARVMDGRGRLDPSLSWARHTQQLGEMASLADPFAVYLSRIHQGELQAGVPLVGLLATRVDSRDERDAVLHFRSQGPVEIYMNGRQVEISAEDLAGSAFPRSLEPQTAPMRLHRGRNCLVVQTWPLKEAGRSWFFGGSLARPDGEAMVDVVIR